MTLGAGLAEGARPSYRRVLSNRSTLFLWVGELVSQSGDCVFAIALPWLVLLETHSAFYVSLTIAVSWIPLLLSSVVGVYVDRINRKMSVILGNLVQAAAALTMAALYAAGILSLPVLLVLVFVLYFFDQFVSTAIDAMLPRMVQDKGELGAINALFSISSSTNRIAGYIVGGAVIALLGVAVPILYDGTTFLFAALMTLVFVSAMYGRIQKEQSEGKAAGSGRRGFRAELAEGARFVRNSKLFIELTIVVSVFNFFSGGTSALIAPYVADSLHLGSLGFGIIVSAVGAGGIIGSYVFGKINARAYAGRLFFAMTLLIAVATMVMGLIPSFYLALSMFFVFGLAGTLVNLPVMTLIQAKVPNEMLGRVFAVLVTFMNGVGPVAAVVAGSIAVAVSTQAVFAYFGLGLILTVVLSYATFRELRSASY
jgi:MFS family permease